MSRPLILGALLSAGFIAMALLSLVWTPYDHALMNIPDKLLPPGGAHLLGTDQFGRDILSMVMVGLLIVFTESSVLSPIIYTLF